MQCHVKTGTNKQREGIASISETVIEVCVSARANEREANKAAREVFSEVVCILVLRWSDADGSIGLEMSEV